MASRIAHAADEWLGDVVPAMPDRRVGGLSTAALRSGAAASEPRVGRRGDPRRLGPRARRRLEITTRRTDLRAHVSIYVALSDRLAAFSVSKLAPMIAIALWASPCSRALRHRRVAEATPRKEAAVRDPFRLGSLLPVLLPVIYCASGIAKMRGDWLHHPYVPLDAPFTTRIKRRSRCSSRATCSWAVRVDGVPRRHAHVRSARPTLVFAPADAADRADRRPRNAHDDRAHVRPRPVVRDADGDASLRELRPGSLPRAPRDARSRLLIESAITA